MTVLGDLMRFTLAKIDLSKNYLFVANVLISIQLDGWLETKTILVLGTILECSSKDEKSIVINDETREQLSKMCQMKRNIVVWSVAGCLSLSFAVVAVVVVLNASNIERLQFD